MVRIIWDIHWATDKYLGIIKYSDESIQVGDFWFKKQHRWHERNVDAKFHKVLFWNHDDTRFLNKDHSLWDFGHRQLPSWFKFFVIRWAECAPMDKAARIEWKDYFRDEELSIPQGNECVEMFREIKPDVVITHECPEFLIPYLKEWDSYSNRTTQLLQACFESHKPKLWIHWHHHVNYIGDHSWCRFVTLWINKFLDIYPDSNTFTLHLDWENYGY